MIRLEVISWNLVWVGYVMNVSSMIEFLEVILNWILEDLFKGEDQSS